MVDRLIDSAVEAEIGLEDHDHGTVVAYANDVRKLHRFAGSLIDKRSLFRAIRLRERSESRGSPRPRQYKLPLADGKES
jgi:hypothetical protein